MGKIRIMGQEKHSVRFGLCHQKPVKRILVAEMLPRINLQISNGQDMPRENGKRLHISSHAVFQD